MRDFRDEVKLNQRASVRLAYIALGHVCLVTGIIGIFLPLLPTVPFILLASVCYAKGSLRFYNWIMNHKYFGPPLRDWRETKALPMKSKVLAISLIVVSAGTSIFFLIPLTAVKWFIGVSCSAVILYLAVGIPTRQKR